MKMIRFRKHLSYIGVILLLLPLASLVTATPAPQEVRSGAPSVMSYQGQVQVGGTPVSGTGYFKFAVVSSAGTTSYWSNDGTSNGGGEPSAGVALSVDNGLFNVLLGDTDLSGMTLALSADVFSGKNRYLRVWFSSDDSTYQQLTPDQRIAAVAYALQAEKAADADTLDGLEGSDYQLQVSGDCEVGSTIQSINDDGSVACEAHDTKPGFSRATVDSNENHGWYTSIAIGVDGLPVISHYSSTREVVRVAHCGDISCSAGNTLSHAGCSYETSSIAIGADGLPVISYLDYDDSYLKVVHCGNVACSTGNTQANVDTTGIGAEYISIAIGVDGLPVISYYDADNGDLKVAHCGDATCTTGNIITTLDSDGLVGKYTSIAIGGDGLPVISYWHWGGGNLKVAHCSDVTCSAGHTVKAIDFGETVVVGLFTSITIGRDGLPIISYYDDTNGDLKVAHCGSFDCTTLADNTITTVDSTGNVGEYTAITIGADGLPVISYYDYTKHDLKVAHCGNIYCSTNNTLTTVDSTGNVGQYTSITIGVDGLPIISYRDATNTDLRVAHCSNVFCIPYWRRR